VAVVIAAPEILDGCPLLQLGPPDLLHQPFKHVGLVDSVVRLQFVVDVAYNKSPQRLVALRDVGDWGCFCPFGTRFLQRWKRNPACPGQ
jgi:hypothetical protein